MEVGLRMRKDGGGASAGIEVYVRLTGRWGGDGGEAGMGFPSEGSMREGIGVGRETEMELTEINGINGR